MANETVATETTADRLAELGCQLDDARVVLDFMTDMQLVDIGHDPKKIHGAACTAFRLVCNAIGALEAAEAQLVE